LPASASSLGLRTPPTTPARRNPPPDPPKILLRRLPSAHLGLGVATSRSGSPETDGHKRRKYEPQSR
jgi:hypothetical protein